MNLIDFMSGSVADALGWTLLHAIWQGFALVLPTAVALHLLRNKSSNLRYRVSSFTLLTQLLVSVATFVWYYQPVSTIVPALTESLPVNWQAIAHTLGRQPLPWHYQVQQFLEIHLNQFVLVYLIGVALFGIRLAGGWVYLQRLSRTATLPPTTAWTELVDTLRSALAVRVVVQVRESARIAVPMVVGILKPVLLIPIGLATNLSMREVEAVLAHELAHIKRHDYAVNLLQSVMEVLYFFHPALWWLSARVREEREHCCDDLAVIAIGGNGRMLAQALARVEEIRLMQTAQPPALAMAFASKRQHLLHRVQRMLGVPTRPFISNGSLVGLTLATLLLMSVSVYAVQQNEPQPKPRKAQSKASRRHKVDGNTEFGFTDNRKVDYVIWKGKKLPAAHIARLQQQYDQVMTGQRSLDAVKQPDRDILLTIIETNNSFGEGMDALAEGLGKIDYDNIVVRAQAGIPVNVDDALKEVASVDYNSLIGDAMAAVSNLNISSDSRDKQRAYHEHQLDSLPDRLAIDNQLQETLSKLWEANAALHEQMNEHRQAFEEIFTRIHGPLEQRKQLMQERVELQKQVSLMRGQIKNPAFLPVKEVLENEITTVEKNLSQLKQRIDNLIKTEIRPFISNQIQDQHFERMNNLIDSIRSNEGEIIDVKERVETGGLDGVISVPKPPGAPNRVRPATPPAAIAPARPAIPSHPARPPRPAKAPNVIMPAAPAMPVAPPAPNPMPRVGVRPKIAPVPRPAAPSAPRPAPKPDDN
ncbi:M56 family metallopeptidase [Spirosoma utsteinense]|uniref:Beta-lactamase regulating signal transducer with metallopeptidase domain n=1 Tax=Spirosoma utsteinense TaxID=2585773 RepID=A0ABR6W4P4_9BACT|nr:M56 family metallopeptidase [Spirosoma utsteinense]MBC3785393.1 beta-lactamase regulating signal transducer with metallopeptidase domain [Spirosoma utsteinense]MBC3791579.1 beta-lactamase regulating signal transducer with metallopeptidase domain [Spirosoma utsteinense]